MGISTLSVIVSIVVLSISLKDTTRAPRWLRTLTFNYLARTMCMKEGMPELEEARNKVDDAKLEDVEPLSEKPGKKAAIEAEPRDNLERLILLLLKEKTDAGESSMVSDEWKAIAKVLDRIFFWVFLIAVGLGIRTIIMVILMFS